MLNKRILIISATFFSIAFIATSLILFANHDLQKENQEENQEERQKAETTIEIEDTGQNIPSENVEEPMTNPAQEEPKSNNEPTKTPTASNKNCTTTFGKYVLINPNFTVSTDWIANRKAELVNIDTLYGIKEGNQNNGAPLLDAEAAIYLNEMLSDYKNTYAGHDITTRSCFRSVGTKCGRLCYATGTSDHHTGYTCDLIDNSYGSTLDTDYYNSHPEWQWLHENSYKYGFIDRFIKEWAGGSMLEPANVSAEGTTGLYETWHYRYVGIEAATEIATGKYNNGKYDSLEHYLLASGRIGNLLDPTSCK